VGTYTDYIKFSFQNFLGLLQAGLDYSCFVLDFLSCLFFSQWQCARDRGTVLECPTQSMDVTQLSRDCHETITCTVLYNSRYFSLWNGGHYVLYSTSFYHINYTIILVLL
jgi:hypothetical protein